MKLSQLLLEYKRDITLLKSGDKLSLAGSHDGGKSSEEVLDVLERIDPTKNKQYVQWLVGQYVSKKFRLEDEHRVKTVLGQFIAVKNKLEQKDINRYSFHELEAKMDEIHDVSLTDTSDEVNDAEVKVLYDGPLGKLAIPLTQEASCKLGSGTKWCTAARENNMFDHYNFDGPLYIWRGKNGKKYQFHFQSQQFMNDRDEQISRKELKYFMDENPVTSKMFSAGFTEMAKKMSYAEMIWYSIKFGESSPLIIPEFEAAMLASEDPDVMLDYISRVKHEEWPEAEKFIFTNPKYVSRYAVMIGKRFEEWEQRISENYYDWKEYSQRFGLHPDMFLVYNTNRKRELQRAKMAEKMAARQQRD